MGERGVGEGADGGRGELPPSPSEIPDSSNNPWTKADADVVAAVAEEFGAAVFMAQATILLDRIKYCMRGHEAAEVRRYTQRARWSSREAFVACRGHPRGQFRHRRPCSP